MKKNKNKGINDVLGVHNEGVRILSNMLHEERERSNILRKDAEKLKKDYDNVLRNVMSEAVQNEKDYNDKIEAQRERDIFAKQVMFDQEVFKKISKCKNFKEAKQLALDAMKPTTSFIPLKTPYKDVYETFHDMQEGPCACGAWHSKNSPPRQ